MKIRLLDGLDGEICLIASLIEVSWIIDVDIEGVYGCNNDTLASGWI